MNGSLRVALRTGLRQVFAKVTRKLPPVVKRETSVPIPKFAQLCRTLESELRNRRTLTNVMILVPL